MYDINAIFKRIYSAGIALDLPILDTIRKRIINIIIATIIVSASMLIFYRLFLADWDSVIVNSLVVSFSMFLYFLCIKGKHELALFLFTILILLLTLNLNMYDMHTSSVIYYALLPIGTALLFKNRIIKHLVYFMFMLCFFLSLNSKGYDVNFYITYVAATGLFYFAILNFIHFVERKQNEIDQVLKQRELTIVELEARNTNLQQFSFICSHDIREPVHVIGKYSGLIQKKMFNPNSVNEYSQYFKFIDSNVRKLSKLVETLQIFTDVNSRNQIKIEKVSFNNLLNKSSIKLSQLIEDKKAKVVFTNKTDTDFIYSSEYGLDLIIQNLVENALKFNKSDQPNVVVTLDQREDNLLLQVEDNGIGVEEQYLQYIFEPFKRMNHRLFYDSSGLGLAICKEIVNKINGEIWVESTVGKGSTFFVLLRPLSVL